MSNKYFSHIVLKKILKYEKIKTNQSQFLSLPGLSIDEFTVLAKDFDSVFTDYISHYTFEGKLRIRLYKPRKTSSLPSIEDKLFLTLIFLKTNPLQEHHGASFGITQPKANMYIHLFVPLLRQTLKNLGELPHRKSTQLDVLLKNCEEVLLDGTGRPIQKPSDDEMADEHYSGKKNS